MIERVQISNTTYASGNQKFEAGTPPIVQVIGFSAAIDFLKSLNMKNVFSYETELHDYAIDKMRSINNINIYGKSKHKGSIISFNIGAFHFNDLAILLDKKNIAIRTGHHCCQPLHRYLGINSSARASLSFTTTKEEIDIFTKELISNINFLKNNS